MTKKIMALVMVLAICLSLTVIPVHAEEDPLDSIFQQKLGGLAYWLNFNTGDVDINQEKWRFIVRNAFDRMVEKYNPDLPYGEALVVPAQEYEQVLDSLYPMDEHLVSYLTEQFSYEISYNAADDTYSLRDPGGKGGYVTESQYAGYKEVEGKYYVYYQHRDLEFLSGAEAWEYVKQLGWPEKVTYNGKEYIGEAGDYYRVAQLCDYGVRYTVELNGENVRLLGIKKYKGMAENDPCAELLTGSATYYLRYLTSTFTKQESVDNRIRELINLAVYDAVYQEFGDEFEIQLPAERYLQEVEKRWVITDKLVAMLQAGNGYDSATDTYMVYSVGYAGALGTPRVFRGYEKVGDYYKVYFRYTEGVMAWAVTDGGCESYWEKLGYPLSFIYEGKEYADNLDSILYQVTGDKNNGICFTMELVDGKVRLVSADYFSDVDVAVKDSGVVSVTDTMAFAKGTKVTVEEQTKGTIYKSAAKAMRNISGQYLVYEFNATLDGAAVQPDGTVEVKFAVPNAFWHEDTGRDTTLYYLAPDGSLEAVETEWDQWGDSLIARLSHFSTYILVDNLVEPPVRLPGDLTGDDEVNYSDALLLLRATINLATLTPEQEVAADFNGDGAINYMDALAILRDSIGL